MTDELGLPLTSSMTSDDIPGLMQAIAATGLYPGAPTRQVKRSADPPETDDWKTAIVDHDIALYWGEGWTSESVRTSKDERMVRLKSFGRDPTTFLLHHCDWPFLFASIPSWHPWNIGIRNRTKPLYQPDASFGFGHFQQSFAAAFQGAGHDWITHRRVLEHGPWLTRYGANDTTIIQYYDPEADAETALEQAKVGHKHMTGLEGAFYWIDIYPPRFFTVEYNAEVRRLEGVVADEGPDGFDLRCFKWLADTRKNADDEPVDSCAIIYEDEATAHRNLHRIWVHGIEVWFKRGGELIRLDADYDPPVVKPDWVQAVLEREG